MRAASSAFWGILVLTLAVYLAMVGWTLPAIQSAAGGLVAFDLRPGGYSHAEALAFLTALSDQGRALYLGTQHWLDTAFPPLLSVTLAWAIWRLTPGWPRALRVAPMALAGVAAGFDLLENARVRRLLLAEPEAVSASMVAAANTASVAKAVLSSVAFAALLAVLLWRAKAWMRR